MNASGPVPYVEAPARQSDFQKSIAEFRMVLDRMEAHEKIAREHPLPFTRHAALTVFRNEAQALPMLAEWLWGSARQAVDEERAWCAANGVPTTIVHAVERPSD